MWGRYHPAMHCMVGREAELRDVEQLVRNAIEGRGGARLIVGEAGVGKSRLLDELDQRVGAEMTVLRITGVEDEVDLSWSGIASLVRPLVGGAAYTAIAPARRAVLDSALFLLGDGDSRTATDPYAVALALLDLLTHAGAERPMLVLVDDLQWLDPPSARALGYVGRRLDREFIAMVATSRSLGLESGMERIDLQPPSKTEADDILRHLGVGSAAVRTVLVESVGTNPLMLATCAAALDPDVRRGARRIPDPLPFPGSVMDGARRRVASLDCRVREALLGIAVLGHPPLADAQLMVERLHSPAEVLEDAERSGIIAITDHVAFTHPTLRTAVHESGSAAERRRLHRLAVDITSQGRVACALHLSMATVAPDDAVGDALDEACQELTHRGALAAAAEQYVRAAQLSEDPTRRASRRLLAAELYLDLGSVSEVQSLLETVEQDVAAPARTNAGIVLARARLLQLQERSDQSCELLRGCAAGLVSDQPDDAALLLLASLPSLVRDGRLADVVQVVGELQALRPRVAGVAGMRIDATAAAFALLGTSAETSDIGAIEALLLDEGSVRSAQFIAEVIAPVLAYARRDEVRGHLLDTVERSLRDQAAIVPLISVLSAQQLRHFAHWQPQSIAAGEEAIRLAIELGRPAAAMGAASGLVVGAAIAGNTELHELAVGVLALSRYPHADAIRRAGRCVLLAATGRVEEAVDGWEELGQVHGFGNPLITWEADYIDALTTLGRLDEASAVLNGLDDSMFQYLPSAYDRVRGILATDDDEAAELFARAIAGARVGRNRLAEARAELCWGERLRRKRRKAQARAHLERSVELFRSVGLPNWAARAEAELAATGALVDATVPAHALLTPREQRIVQLVSDGATNRQIGIDLFLSERTVESHLSSIYRKLQVKNRRELATRSLADHPSDPDDD
ncbi:MAG: transcriptional regulator, LuxR family [Acidimicrobiales bacterium]|nr:transcriptional regulator, LuxR family [Acidimicrobiales bacterium]